MAAAALGDRASLWANVTWSSFDEDHPTIAFNGDAVSGFLGADYLFTDQFVAGIAVGAENTDVTSTFNAGGSNSDGITGLGYAALVFNRYFSADASVGYTGLYDIDQRRTAAGVAITGSTDGWRVFGAANLNGRYTIDKWTASGNVGYLRSHANTDGFTESNGTVVPNTNSNLGTVRVGGRVSYQLLPAVTPFVSGLFEWDHDRTGIVVGAGQAVPPDDRTDFVVGGGLSFAFSDRVSGGIEATTVLGRANFNSTTVSGNIRFVF
jgi:outer membrane autotransporter protein